MRRCDYTVMSTGKSHLIPAVVNISYYSANYEECGIHNSSHYVYQIAKCVVVMMTE